MSAEIIDGKKIARKTRLQLKDEVSKLKERGITPGLAVIFVGNNSASQTYVRNKQKACEQVGIRSILIHYEDSIDEVTLLNKIEALNQNPEINGILVQLPLPKHINERKVLHSIDPDKDVDGFHPLNIGKLSIGEDGFAPCTPKGIIHMLKEINFSFTGKHAVVVGRSNIVGKPMGQMLLNQDCTVTYCHSKTKNLREITTQADLLICAVGKAHFITEDDVKEGACVIDVGMNRDENGKLVGDVDTEAVRKKASYITPVPGGVGPMTVTMLLVNTIQSAKQALNLKAE